MNVFLGAGSNWPEMPQTITNRAWKEDQQLLHDIHKRLCEAAMKLDSHKLDPKLKRMIYGAAAHDVYHAGQIRLLRRLISKPSRAR